MKQSAHRSTLFVFLFALAVLSAKCSSDQAGQSSLSPSATSAKGVAPAASPQQETEVTGAVTAIAGTCPSVQLTVAGVRFLTNASTLFDRGACANVSVGSNVEIRGVAQGDGSLVATRVHFEDEVPPPAAAPTPVPAPAPAPAPQPGAEVEFTGQVTALSGVCPSIQLTVSSTRIVTSAATGFDRDPCSRIAVGSVVEVRGIRQADGSVVATRVKDEDSHSGPGE
jgi:hypothetical protein